MGIEYERSLGQKEGPLKRYLSSTMTEKMQHLRIGNAKQEEMENAEGKEAINAAGGMGRSQSLVLDGADEESGAF